MFGYSMVQMVRVHSLRLDKALRDKVLNLYRPFKWTPCFLHNLFEDLLKNNKKMRVIIEFEKDCFEEGCKEVDQILTNKRRSTIRNKFSTVSSCSADITPSAIEELLNTCGHIKKIYYNREVKALLDMAVPSANARNVVRNGRTLTGESVTIAVIDTGIHPHRDLDKRIIDFVDFINQETLPYDDNGHGTHCAGDAAGDGDASGGQYAGPAPKANLIGVKVLDKTGSGSLETVMQGVEWCINYNENNTGKKIDIISMSLGAAAEQYENENDDPMVQIVEKAWEKGIVVCVAAGNEGPRKGTIASPGISDQVITVGALDDKNSLDRTDDGVAEFSSRGQTVHKVDKPDILAPGVNIISLRSPNSYLDKLQKSSRVGSDYFVLSGTSMATPICAGIVALILEQNRDLKPLDVKELLKKNTVIWNDKEKFDPNIYGAGYIDAENSIP
jgi:serine protease AprX